MLKVGLIGLGDMGSGHIAHLRAIEKETDLIRLAAVCDIDNERFKNEHVGDAHTYNDYKEMIEKENLDFVMTPIPTYLHCEIACTAMEMGVHVFCEKPMALTIEQCEKMKETSLKTGKKLMIGQCLRFWPTYEILKKYVDEKIFGEVISGVFFRGGSTPRMSYQNWLLNEEKGGGALFDQHVHDTDMINWLFGMPEKVVSTGKVVYDGSGHDSVITTYFYPDNKVLMAHDDWTQNSAIRFPVSYRVNFEKGTVASIDGKILVSENGGELTEPHIDPKDGYHYEVLYFADAIANNKDVSICTPDSTIDTMKIVHAEKKSAHEHGSIVTL